jgi:hypothetical protein
MHIVIAADGVNVSPRAEGRAVLSEQMDDHNDTAEIAVSNWASIASEWRAEYIKQVAAAVRVLLGDAPQPLSDSADASELEVADKLIKRCVGRVNANCCSNFL